MAVYLTPTIPSFPFTREAEDWPQVSKAAISVGALMVAGGGVGVVLTCSRLWRYRGVTHWAIIKARKTMYFQLAVSVALIGLGLLHGFALENWGAQKR